MKQILQNSSDIFLKISLSGLEYSSRGSRSSGRLNQGKNGAAYQ
jgi:hypothetical protein